MPIEVELVTELSDGQEWGNWIRVPDDLAKQLKLKDKQVVRTTDIETCHKLVMGDTKSIGPGRSPKAS